MSVAMFKMTLKGISSIVFLARVMSGRSKEGGQIILIVTAFKRVAAAQLLDVTSNILTILNYQLRVLILVFSEFLKGELLEPLVF